MKIKTYDDDDNTMSKTFNGIDSNVTKANAEAFGTVFAGLYRSSLSTIDKITKETEELYPGA